MGESLKEAAKVLKMDGDSFNETLNSFVVDIGRISIQGMNSEQIQETLTNVFSKLGDDMASAMMPWLTDFQNVGEGMLETLVRVSSTVATVDGIFDSIGQTMNVTGLEGIKAKMNLAELAGGLQELSGLVSNFYDKFYTEAEKQANTTRLVTEEFERLGIQMLDLNASDVRIKFRELVNSFRDSNQETYVSLLKLVDAVDSLTPIIEGAAVSSDLLRQKLTLENRIQELTMSSVEYTAMMRQKELLALDSSLRPLQERVWALEDENTASQKALELSKKRQDIELKILSLTDPIAYTVALRQKELTSLDESLKPLQERVWALEDEKVKNEQLIELGKKRQELELNILSLTDPILHTTQLRQKELAVLDESLRPLQERIWYLEDEKSAIENLKTLANDAFSVLEKSINAEKTAMKKTLDEKIKNINAIKDAETASYEASKLILEAQAKSQQETFTVQKEMFSSQLEVAKDAADAVKTLFNDINDAILELTNGQSQLQNQTYLSAKTQLDSALVLAKASGVLPDPDKFKATLDVVKNVDPAAFSSLFDYQREKLQTAGKLSQLGGIVGGEITKRDATVVAIETSISSIERLKIVTEDASKNSLALLEAQHKENLERLDKQIKELENQYEASVFYLDGLLQKAEDQLNIAFGTYTAILSVSSALSSYNTILLSYIDAISSDTAQQVNKVQTISTSNVAQTGANINSSNVAEEIKQLREELAAQNRAIAQNTLATAKILAQWDGDGQPETRVV
jgi:hypothetical protein